MKVQSVVIEAKDLTIGYRHGKRGEVVHSHLNFALCRGELTCLLGSNGAGKSTLLRTLAAVQPPLSGDITLLGKPLASYSPKERSWKIGIVLTDKTQAGGLSVRELVALGRQPHTGFFGRLGKKIMKSSTMRWKQSAWRKKLQNIQRNCRMESVRK